MQGLPVANDGNLRWPLQRSLSLRPASRYGSHQNECPPQ
jgi:hypothetical protein